MNRRPILLFVMPLVALSLSACGAGDSSDGASAGTEPAMADSPSVSEVEGAADLIQSGDQRSDSTQPAVNTLIIRASVQMHADEVPPTVDKVIATVTEFDGSVAARKIVNRDPENPADAYATLTVRVPPDRAEEFLQALGTVGTVDSIDQSAEDVAGQLVDLDVRITNAQASVDRIRELMETTTNIDELTRLESELTARQTALEQLEAQQKGLTSQTAMATIDVSISSTESLGTPEPTDSSLVDAAKNAWNIFVQVLYVILLILIYAAPFLIVGWLLWKLGQWRSRRRAARQAAELQQQQHAAGAMPPPNERDSVSR